MSFKILLVDDDEASHVYNKVMIESAGIPESNILSYYSVDQATDLLKRTKESNNVNNWPKVIICDLNMPKKKGWDLIDDYRIIADETFKSDIYLVTNSENPNDIERALKINEVKDIKLKYLDSAFYEQLCKELKE